MPIRVFAGYRSDTGVRVKPHASVRIDPDTYSKCDMTCQKERLGTF